MLTRTKTQTIKAKQPKQAKPKQPKRKVVTKPKAAVAPKPVAVEPAPQPVAVEAKARLAPMKLDDVLTILTPNPYRNGNLSWVSFEKYVNGMTVQQALDLGIPRSWLSWDRRYAYIRVAKPGE